MTNVLKYLVLLESLDLTETKDASCGEKLCFESNVQKLKKCIKIPLDDLFQAVIRRLASQQLSAYKAQSYTCSEQYAILLMYVLLEIIENTNFDSDAKEDLIATRHTAICAKAIQDVNTCAVRSNLHPAIFQCGVFSQEKLANRKPNYELLSTAVEFLSNALKVKQFYMANAMELVVRDYMAAIFSLLITQESKEYQLDEGSVTALKSKLNFIWSDIAKVEYFRNILLMKSIRNIPTKIQQQLHECLLQKLVSPDGFTTLVATLFTPQRITETEQHNEKRVFDVIAKIVAHKGHSNRFQQTIIDEIFRFIDLCLSNQPMAEAMGAGLLTLRRLYDLREENHSHIRGKVFNGLKVLIEPTDLINGLILMEHVEFCTSINRLYHLFCTSSVESLPSELLIEYQPMLLQLYYNIPEGMAQKQQLSALILRCLNNRNRRELQTIVEQLYKCDADKKYRKVHQRIVFSCNVQRSELTFKVGPDDLKQDFNISLALPELLMHADFHMLTYEIFMILLCLESTLMEEGSGSRNFELLQTEEELLALLNTEYSVRVEVLLSLNTLISHPPLRLQIAANSGDFLKQLRNMIEKRLEKCAKNLETVDEILLIMLTLAHELVQQAQIDTFRAFLPTLRKLESAGSANKLLNQRLSALIRALSGDIQSDTAIDSTPFSTARSLIESGESYLQVYGIQILLGLLKRKDAATLANGHVIIALALSTLKDKESYTFLNCVRLFAGLVYVLEDEVLEVLSGEYLNENANMDYRLVVGEAILKVGHEIGPLCYKYKDVLLNCFMYGVRSPLNEFRMSAFANLSQMCRILTYQVHRFFNELLNLIHSELTTGTYIAAKRAAVLVLAELLQGIDNLPDFEDVLLPTYRLLKAIESDEKCDEKMRIHAANGLKTLAEKCRQFLFPQQGLEKQIKILGIKDDTNKPSRPHSILEIS